eukprot:m.128550 g.128550  ORF g.128550 m.128550 type:complete len:95 (-) comp52295_c0_seq7:7667-7951(-)
MRSLFKASTVRPRYSASASVCDLAACAATSETTTAFSLRLRLKVYSSHLLSQPCGFGSARELATICQETRSDGSKRTTLQRDRHLRWFPTCAEI